MPTLAEYDLLSALTQIRESGIEALGFRQAFLYAETKTKKNAASEMFWFLEKALGMVEPREIVPQHPLIGAISTLSRHPDLPSNVVLELDRDRAEPAARALEERQLDWSPRQLEWQLVQFLKVSGAEVYINPRLQLEQQYMPNDLLQAIWNRALDVAVLRGRGLL